MSIIAKSDGKTFELVPAGTHVARLYQIIHIGTIPTTYMGEEREVDTIRLSFELPLETKVFKEGEGEKPYVMSQEYTLSMNEKANLRAVVEGLIGTALHDDEARAFDITDLLGKPCLINIQHKKSQAGREYAKIASVSPLPKGQAAPPQVNPSYIFDWEHATEEDLTKFPDWIQAKMRSSKEYEEKFRDGIDPDDVPF